MDVVVSFERSSLHAPQVTTHSKCHKFTTVAIIHYNNSQLSDYTQIFYVLFHVDLTISSVQVEPPVVERGPDKFL